MPSAEPVVSIGIPTFNRAAYVVRAVRSALDQSYRSIQVIVSDNASVDDTREALTAISDPRLKVVHQESNLGMVGNFNACLRQSTGEFFLMLSDDDVLDTHCIEHLIAPFLESAGSEIGVSWSPVRILDPAGTAKYETEPGPARESGVALVEGLFFGTRGPRFCSVLVRRLDAQGYGYTEEHGPICDIGNWCQIALTYPRVACFQTPLSGYTVHPASITSVPNGELWQRSGVAVSATLQSILKQRGQPDLALRIDRATAASISNLIATVMIQRLGQPGWLRYWISEAVRAPRYLFAPVVFKRLFKDGWKLVRLAFPSPEQKF